MNRSCLAFIAALSFLTLVSCVEPRDGAPKGKEVPVPSASEPAAPPGHFPPFTDQVLAIVGPERITRKALEYEVVNRRYSVFRRQSVEEACRRALENLMGMRLFYLGAVDDGILRGTALEREIEITKRVWLAGIYITEKIPRGIRITDKDLGDDIPSRWDTVDASIIVFSSREEASDIQAKIASGALTFEQAAARSIMRTRQPGGGIGEIRRNTSYFPNPEHVAMIFSLSPGQKTAPFEGPLGWTIVRVNGKRMLSRKEIDGFSLGPRNKALTEKTETLKKEILKRHDVRLFPEKLPGAAPETTVAILGQEKFSYNDLMTFRRLHGGRWMDPGAGDPEKSLNLFGNHLAWAEDARRKGVDLDPGIKERMILYTAERVSDEVRNRLEREITVTDKQAQEYFRSNPERFRGEDQAWIKAIFLKDEKIAGEVKARAEKGEDFVSLIREFSTEKSQEDFGPITRKMIPGEFGAEIFSMREGDVSRVLRAGENFVVAKMVRFKKAGKVTFAQVKDQVVARLRQEKVAPAVYGRLDELKKRFPAVVNEEEFGRFVKEQKIPSGGGPDE